MAFLFPYQRLSVVSCLLVLLAGTTSVETQQNGSSVDVLSPYVNAGGSRELQQKLDMDCCLITRLLEATSRRRTLQLIQNISDEQLLQVVQPKPFQAHVAPEPNIDVLSFALCGVGMSFLAGLSTTIGAGFVLMLPSNEVSPALMAFALALAGGVMLSATIMEFWLPLLLIGSTVNVARLVFCSAVGAGAFLLVSYLVPEPKMIEEDLESFEGTLLHTACKDPAVVSPQKAPNEHSWRLASVLMISLTLHNFPEGFAVGISSLAGDSTGFVVMLAVALHNIPEGIAIAVPVLAATGSRKMAVLMTLVSGLAEPLGALLSLVVVNLSGTIAQESVENLLCSVGGIMVVVALKELLPEACNYGKPRCVVGGVLLGAVLMLFTTLLGA